MANLQTSMKRFLQPAPGEVVSVSQNGNEEANSVIPTTRVPLVNIHVFAFVIQNITFHFPFKRYPGQVEASKMLCKAFSEKKWCAIEMPTGNGKTPILLTMAIGFFKAYNRIYYENCQLEYRIDKRFENADKPIFKIYYVVTRHTLGNQVVEEIQKLQYNPRMTMLASRKHLCLNPAINKPENIGELDTLCRDLQMSKEGCRFKKALESLNEPAKTLRSTISKKISNNSEATNNGFEKEKRVFNMSDAIEALGGIGCCAYYVLDHEFLPDSDFVITTFPNVFNKGIRKRSGLNMENCIVILDEAHNLPDLCQSAASFTFQAHDVIHLIFALNQKRDHAQKADYFEKKIRALKDEAVEKSCTAAITKLHNSLSAIITLLNAFKAFYKELEAEVPENRKEFTFPWQDAKQKMEKHGIWLAKEECSAILKHVDALSKKVSKDSKTRMAEEILNEIKPESNALSLVSDFIDLLEYFTNPDNTYTYVCNLKYVDEMSPPNPPQHVPQLGGDTDHAAISPTRDALNLARPRIQVSNRPGHSCQVNFWNFYAKVAFMDAVQNAHAVVVASGTLAPIPAYTKELGVDFPLSMSSEQVIPKENYIVMVLPCDANQVPFEFTFEHTRKSAIYERSLNFYSETIALLPKGILIFVPSYEILERFKAALLSNPEIDAEIRGKKGIYFEHRINSKSQEALEHFREESKTTKGAIFFAVHRGKYSEGVNFYNVTLVMVAGIPYPNIKDERYIQKLLFNDTHAIKGQTLTSKDLVQAAAANSTAQVLGRTLRDRFKPSMLAMQDSRFVGWTKKKLLPEWIMADVKILKTPEAINQETRQFCDFHGLA